MQSMYNYRQGQVQPGGGYKAAAGSYTGPYRAVPMTHVDIDAPPPGMRWQIAPNGVHGRLVPIPGYGSGGQFPPFSSPGYPKSSYGFSGGPVTRMVPSGSPGGYARVPNVRAWRDPVNFVAVPRAAMRFAASQLAKAIAGSLYQFDLEYENQWGNQTRLDPAAGGWTRCATPTQACHDTWNPDLQAYSTGGCLGLGTCPVGQVVGGTITAIGNPVSSTFNRMLLIKQTSSLPRYSIGDQYGRPAAYPSNKGPAYRAAVRMAPWAPPLPLERQKELVRHARGSFPKPYQVTALDVEVSSGSKFPRITPVLHDNLPPPRGVPSRKKGKVLVTLAHGLYGGLTEVGDFVDCLQRAVTTPRGVGTRRVVNPNVHVVNGVRMTPLQSKIAFVWANRGLIDWNKAARCVIFNHYQDKAIGMANSVNKKLVAEARKTGLYNSPAGIGFGGFSQRMR